jgi:hypothetical protein
LIINIPMEYILLYSPASHCFMPALSGIKQDTKHKTIMTLTTKTTETMKPVYSNQTEVLTWRSLHHSV